VKIAFVTSGLEPEANGVGDYTRRLAAELTRTGHVCRLIALNEPPNGGGMLGGPLRLTGEMEWPGRVRLAARALDEFNPDWASLQFVSYGFNPRGIIRNQAAGLASLFSARRTHFMFHEIWTGERANAGWKERFTGAIQKKYILDLFGKIRPRLVTTTNAVYRAVLARNGVEAHEHPLFGNIEPGTAAAGDWLRQRLHRAGVEIPGERNGYWLFGFFGIIQSEWSPESVFPQIAEAAGGKRPVMLWVGRAGGGRKRVWDAMARDYPAFTFIRLGAQPAERVSEFLNTIDAGISTMPVELIRKSGTAVAMFEHGVPVIVSREEPFRGIGSEAPDEPLLRRADGLAAGLPSRGEHRCRLPEAAAMLLRDMEG